MQRRLILLRHATAVSGANLATDHERPLAARGTGEAEATARRLQVLGWVPDRALVSDAARTSETWWCMAERLGSPPTSFLPSFYCAGIDQITAVLARLEPGVRTVVAIGHNPGWSDAIGWLCGTQALLAPAHGGLLEAEGERWADVVGYQGMRLVGIVGPEDSPAG